MNAVAAQERTRMLSRSMPIGRIRVSAMPSEKRNTINDQIAGPNQPTAESGEHAENEQCLRQRRATELAALALLRRTRNARMTIFVERETACQGKRGPRT